MAATPEKTRGPFVQLGGINPELVTRFRGLCLMRGTSIEEALAEHMAATLKEAKADVPQPLLVREAPKPRRPRK